jgi:hypothetical protein
MLLALLGLVLVGGYLFLTIWELARLPYDIGGAFLVAPMLVVLSIPMLAQARRIEPDPWVKRLFPFSLVAIAFMGFVHYLVDFVYYGGVADARLYSRDGMGLAAQFWQGDFSAHLRFPLIGTGFIILLTGMIFSLIGPTTAGGYLVYSWLAFWGLYFCYRAFRTAMPGADYRRYAVLVFFLPSILFWSSGIGKGAWMILSIGLALVGVARLVSSAPRSILPLLAGLGGSALVRPHVTALLVVALIAGALVRRTVNANLLSPIVRVGTVGMLAVLAAVTFSRVASFLKLDSLSLDSVAQGLDKSQQNSEIGNSAFTAIVVHSPLDVPAAATTVLFRPFPWEAESLVMLASSVESFLLVAFVVLSWRRWLQVPRLLRRYPYVLVALVAILMFVIVFSTFSNFGLLVRERVMIFPLVLVPLCLIRGTPATANDLGSTIMKRVAVR